MSIDVYNISPEELNKMIQYIRETNRKVCKNPQIFSQYDDYSSETVEFEDLALSNVEKEHKKE